MLEARLGQKSVPWEVGKAVGVAAGEEWPREVPGEVEV